MSSRRRYSAEDKARIVADLDSGMSQREVAAKWDMPVSTVAHLSRTSKRGIVNASKLASLTNLNQSFLSRSAATWRRCRR